MKLGEIVAKAKDYLIPANLLFDIVQASEGPVIVRADGLRHLRYRGQRLSRFQLGQDVRGPLSLVRDRHMKEPATEISAHNHRNCLAGGLMFSVRGKFKTVLRFAPPFTTSDADLDGAAGSRIG